MSELRDKMLEGFSHNMFDPRERILTDAEGNPLAGVTLWHMEAWGHNHIHIEDLRALERGGGRKTMELLVKRADQYGATMDLTAKPLEAVPGAGKKMRKPSLIKWYKQFGFVQDRPGSNRMTRLPR